MKVLIGADPEVFVKKNGVFVSAHGLVPGGKAAPAPVPFGAVQVDGMALEFNIDPAPDGAVFRRNISEVFKTLKQMVPEHEVVIEPVAVFGDAEFMAAPPESKVLGCDPDYNAWTGDKNPRPDHATTMRTASGHIHVGWAQDKDPFSPLHFADCCSVAKQLDYTLGLYSLSWDTENRRRQMYGQAGAFRPKPYGVEYRVLSNAWLRRPELIDWVYAVTKLSVDRLEMGINYESRFGDYPVNVIQAGETDWWKDGKGNEIYHQVGLNHPQF